MVVRKHGYFFFFLNEMAGSVITGHVQINDLYYVFILENAALN